MAVRKFVIHVPSERYHRFPAVVTIMNFYAVRTGWFLFQPLLINGKEIPKGSQNSAGTRIRHLTALRKSPWKFIIWTNDLEYHRMLLAYYTPAMF